MFVLSLKNGNDDPTRIAFDEYCIPLVEIKDFIALIDNKPFFDQPVKKTRRVWKTYRNIKKLWLYNRKFIRLFISLKLL